MNPTNPRRPPKSQPIELQPLKDACEATGRAGENDPAPEIDPPFELAPLAGEPNSTGPRDIGKVEQASAAYEAPIPAHPLHVCPTCDYNLTGLTSRRCPECGEPFTLIDARRTAIDKSFGWSTRLRMLPQWERARLLVGVALTVISILAVNVIHLGAGRSLVSFQGGLMVIALLPTLIWSGFLQDIMGWTPSDVALIVGVVMTGIGVLFILF